MASKAEVEKMAKRMYRISRHARGLQSRPGTAQRIWGCFSPASREMWRALARWHLRKAKEAYNRGLDDVVGSGDYD